MNERNRILFTERRSPRLRILLVFLLLLILCAWAYAAPRAETLPFNDHLKNPPVFVPETLAEKENAATRYSDEIHAIHAAEGIGSKDRPASVTTSPVPGGNWSLSLEAKNSPVREDHGNAERNESLGGLIKGTLHF